MEAARWLFNGSDPSQRSAAQFEPDDSVLYAMRAMGAPQADIDAVAARIASAQPSAGDADDAGQHFDVYADNWRSVIAFYAVQTQWQYAGMAGVRTGLCYAGVTAWLHTALPRRWWRGVLADIQIMERAALTAAYENQKTD